MRDNYSGQLGKERREARPTQQDYLVLSRLSRMIQKNVSKYLVDKNAAILDMGCGEKPYQPFFLGRSSMYIGIDVRPNECVDLLCDGTRLPFKDNIFSVCLCLQVLEHCGEPKNMIDEILRVLKPGGLFLLSTHGSWPIHDPPNDYWRWTEYGLRRLLASFRICELCKCGGSAASIVQLLELFIPRRSIGIIAIFLLNRLGDLLDRLTWLDSKLPNLAVDYLVTAKKIGNSYHEPSDSNTCPRKDTRRNTT